MPPFIRRRRALSTALLSCIVITASGAVTATPAHASSLTTPVAAGISSYPLPDRIIVGRESDRGTDRTTTAWNEVPYQRFESNGVRVGSPVTWRGRTVNRNELQLLAWDHRRQAWSSPIDAAAPATPGSLVNLSATLSGDHIRDGSAQLIVVDGPRTSTAFADANRTPDQGFADPRTYDFALLHMTDTQFLAEGFPSEFEAMTRWTADNADRYKIGFVSHTGDVIQNWYIPGTAPAIAHREFRRAAGAMSILDDVVPYGVLPGNHDNQWNLGAQILPDAHRTNHQIYNQYFGPHRFSGRPYWGGSVTPDDAAANYQLVTMAGARFLMLNIGYNPTPAMLSWAERVLAAHPDHNVIIGTHYYLDADGTRAPRLPVDVMAGSGHEIYQRLVIPFENVFLVLSGHIHAQATAINHHVGSTDRTVVQLLADYQDFEVDRKRSTGFQRLLQVDIDSSTMAVTTHSPVLNTTQVHRHDPDNRYRPEDGEFVTKISLRGNVPREVTLG